MFEYVIAALLVAPAARVLAARLGTLVIFGGILLQTLPATADSGCGCYGGWVAVSPSVHLLLAGLALIALAIVQRDRRTSGTPEHA